MTAVQSLLVAVSLTAAPFLAAMSWGMQRPELFFTAVILMATLGGWLTARRRRTRAVRATAVRTTALVMGVSPPPIGQIVGRCIVRLRVDPPTGRPFTVRIVVQTLPLTRWPRPGARLPVEIPRTGPRRVRVLWDLVAPHPLPTPQTQPVPAPRPPSIFTDYAPGALAQDAVANPEDIGPDEGEHAADDG